MPKLRVHSLAISIDGYAAGPDQSLDNPFGVGGPALHEWVFATRTGRQMSGLDGGSEGIDDEFAARGDAGIGATIMGRNMFGPLRGVRRQGVRPVIACHWFPGWGCWFRRGVRAG